MFERIHTQPGSVQLTLRGGLDGEDSRAMWDGLLALAHVDAREVVVDLSQVSFIDGPGLGAISFLFKRLSARRRRLRVIGACGQPLAMLRHLGLAPMLGVADDEVRRPLLPHFGLAWAR
jgi:anti-anti-sigma factor